MKLNPYLTFNGNCEEAFKAYAKVLGGEILAMMTRRRKRTFRRNGATRFCMPAWCSATTC
jgi:uncharacterized glyoxalase superfamily protein PhnB